MTSAPSAVRSRTTARPRNPAPPVTTTGLPAQNSGAGSLTADSHPPPGEAILERLDVGLDHDPHELLEADRRRPAQALARLGRIAAQRIDLGGTVVLGVDLDDVMPVQAQALGRLVEEVAHRVRLAGRD